jgi:LmbE family N-acetylglucosaminyl deacetylase
MADEESRKRVERTYKRVLVATAHPDDPEFLFGATVAKLVKDGAEVKYLICSDGGNGSRDPTRPSEEIVAIRYAEQRAAATLLGVREVSFLGFRDGSLAPTLELRRAITREIRLFKPDVIITHFPRRVLDIPMEASHPDHTAVGEAVLSAVNPDASNVRAFPELLSEGLEPHRVKEVWLPGYEHPNHYVDATPYVEKKVQAILCHKSQTENSTVPGWVLDWMKWSGSKKGYEYAEEFKRIDL